MMNTYLILINGAFKMGHYHIALGNSIKRGGGKVIYALTDKLPFYTEKIDIPEGEYYVFSEYFKEHYNTLSFDDKYDIININKMYYSEYDRNVLYAGKRSRSNEYYQRLMSNLINFFDFIYRENHVDYCIYESISNSFAYAAFEVLKLNGVVYCGYAGCRLKGRFELFTEEFGTKEYFKKVFDKTLLKDIAENEIDWINEYLLAYKNDEMPSYHPKNTSLDWNFSLFKRYFNCDKMKLLIGSILYTICEFKFLKFTYQTGNPFGDILNGFFKQLRKMYIVRNSKSYFEKPYFEEKYFLYPQHFKPEASTSVLARHYCSDISVIENIAFNLPFGSYLYIKEHFVNFGRVPLSYYKRLKNIPNVKLISCNENTKTLIEKSLGVITLTSTVGFEALMMEKPVFVFGEVFYEAHPNCRKIDSYNNLNRELNDLSVDKSPDINQCFIYAYKKISYIGDIYYHIDKEYKDEYFTQPFLAAINERFSEKNC